MSTRSNSPGPKTPASTQSRRPRKLDRDTATPERLEGSAGGIRLSPSQMSTPTAVPAANPAASKDAAAPKRRKPRKLNREAPSNPEASNTSTKQSEDPAVNNELEALKSRVRGLESKVEQLYQSNTSGSNRSPRRRGKGRKGSSQQQVPTLSSTAAAEPEPAEVEEIEEIGDDSKELLRLEDELENARQDLAAYRPTRQRQRSSRKKASEDDDVEEIQRDGGPGVQRDSEGRQVTLAGSYRIPLPSSVSMNDVKSIQSGIESAQNVAKSFLEQRRLQQAQNPSQKPQPKPAAQPQRRAASAKTAPAPAGSNAGDGQGQSWGEWFGAYSMSISRAVKNIEAEAAIETGPKGKRPAQGARTASAPGPKAGSTGAAGAKRAGRPATQARLSGEQVKTLMS